jgi:hypothetical protein
MSLPLSSMTVEASGAVFPSWLWKTCSFPLKRRLLLGVGPVSAGQGSNCNEMFSRSAKMSFVFCGSLFFFFIFPLELFLGGEGYTGMVWFCRVFLPEGAGGRKIGV